MATELKATPGPWRVKKISFGFAIGPTGQDPVMATEDASRAFANAHLAAAAPDLYAALEAIIAWEQSEDGPFAWEVLGQAKAALAKARGEVA